MFGFQSSGDKSGHIALKLAIQRPAKPNMAAKLSRGVEKKQQFNVLPMQPLCSVTWQEASTACCMRRSCPLCMWCSEGLMHWGALREEVWSGGSYLHDVSAPPNQWRERSFILHTGRKATNVWLLVSGWLGHFFPFDGLNAATLRGVRLPGQRAVTLQIFSFTQTVSGRAQSNSICDDRPTWIKSH